MSHTAHQNRRGSAGNVISALCSFFIPGLGQLIQGRILAALFFFTLTTVGYFFWPLIFTLIGALILHLWSIISAASYNPR